MQNWARSAQALDPGPDRDFAESFGRSPGGKAMLECIFGASPFLASCVVREQGFIRALWERGPDRCVDEILADLRAIRTQFRPI